MTKLKFVKSIGGFHGISAELPTFNSIIEYEEGKIVLNRGYPRFVTHPLVRDTEAYYKEKYEALEALSCQSFEAAIFLIFDYYLKKSVEFFISEGLPSKFYSYFKNKFPDMISKSEITQNNIIIIKKDKFNEHVDERDYIVIRVLSEISSDNVDASSDVDILITRDNRNDIGIILFYTDIFSEINILRRHAGFIASSRKISMKKKPSHETAKNFEEKLKTRISSLEFSNSENCFLYPSGMAAVFSALYSLMDPQKSNFIALGSLYVDTIRILEKWPKKYGLNDTIFINENFESNLLKFIDKKTAGIIFEFPSNPLIGLIDIDEIVSIAHENGVNVICDNTIATPFNFNPFKHEIDFIIHSTTKFLSGKNNHIGGALLVKDRESHKKVQDLKEITNLHMHFNDIKVLWRNLRKFEERMKIINNNALKMANFLEKHESIEKVYYPVLKSDPNHTLSRKYLKGGSGLLSFKLKNSSRGIAEVFYNNLRPPILKGPSLGSEKTLLSPYVIMAHYNDGEEKLRELGFDFYLMRLSVGIEPIEQTINSIKYALDSLK